MNPVFVRMPVAKRVLRLLLALGIALAGGLGSLAAIATTITPLSLSETVRGADAIVVGTITSHQSRWGDATQRWMQTDYTLAVEEVVYPSEQGIAITIGQPITLTYWGGTIGGKGQEVADIRVPVDGERLLMLLHSRWAQGETFAPTMGFNQGLYGVVGNPASGTLAVQDAVGQPLALTSAGHLVRGAAAAAAAGTTALDLPTFTGWLRANINAIKAAPAVARPAVDPNDPRVMKVFGKSPAPAGSIAANTGSLSASAVAPAQGPAAEAGAGIPVAGAATPALATGVAQVMTASANGATGAAGANGAPVPPAWSYAHRWASLPIVINQFPSVGFAPWSPEDQYQMSKWNYYAHDVFHVRVAPTGTYLWGDGVNDIAGFISDAALNSMYGGHWTCGTNCQGWAVTFRSWDGSGWTTEADIALNSALSWTLDDEWVFNGGAAIGFRQTFIHELGHVHGLEHNMSFLALMNYFEPVIYRNFSMPFRDDALGIRAEYPANAVSVTDLGIYLNYYNGPPVCYDGTNFSNCVTEATYPANVIAGGSLTVNDYHVENVGTTTIAVPTIEWYLTAARNLNTAYYLGTSTYPTLPAGGWFFTNSVGRTFTVPGGVPAGNYYLAAYIPGGDGGAGQGSFPFSNNYAFSLNRIAVSVPPSAPTIGIATADNASIHVAFTPNAPGSGTFYWYTADCGGIQQFGYGSPITVFGVSPGSTYTCKVNATTSVATSDWSANSNAVTPFALPGAPTGVTATAGIASASIRVAFTPGALGTGSLGNYPPPYTVNCGGVTHTGYGSPITVVGLVNGTSYTCNVRTTTSVGTGAWSANSNAVTPVAPAADGFPAGGGIYGGWIQPSGSNAPWTVSSDTAVGGTLSLKSGHIFDSQKSDLSYTANFAAGTVSFARKVSSEVNYDYLQFFIDGVSPAPGWSGEQDWAAVSFPITAGKHTLLWRYVKDISESVGSDAAWIDAVQLPSNQLIVPMAPILMLLLD